MFDSGVFVFFPPCFQIETPQEARRALRITQGYLGYLVIGSVRPDLPAATRIRTAAAGQLQESAVAALAGW